MVAITKADAQGRHEHNVVGVFAEARRLSGIYLAPRTRHHRVAWGNAHGIDYASQKKSTTAQAVAP